MKDIALLFSFNEVKRGVKELDEIDRLFSRILVNDDACAAWAVIKHKTERIILNHQKWFKQEVVNKPFKHVIYSIAQKICREEVVKSSRRSFGVLSNEGQRFVKVYFSILRFMAVDSKQISVDEMCDLMDEVELKIRDSNIAPRSTNTSHAGERAFLLICSGLLFLAVADLPVDYYTLLRIVITVCGILVVAREYKSDVNFWVIAFGLVVIVFNPVFPVYLHDRTAWILIDITGGALCLIRAVTWKTNPQ